ncbi:MAG: hypothetical protein ACI4RD_10750 [Kiritimatiellia bacterium]
MQPNTLRTAVGCVLAASLQGGAALVAHADAGDFTPMAYAEGETAVDTLSAPERLVTNPLELAYDGAWAASGAAAGGLRLESAALDAAAELVFAPVAMLPTTGGTYSYAPELATGACRRLRLVALGENGEETVIAETDVAFAVAAGEGPDTAVDTSENSLQRMVDAGETAPLAYDTSWFGDFGGGRLLMKLKRAMLGDATAVVEKTLLDEANPAVGTLPKRLPRASGTYTLSLVSVDAQGNALAEALTVGYVQPLRGFTLVVR